MDLGHFVLNPATLLVLIFGLVEYVKGFGIHGNSLRAISLALGVALAIAYRLREAAPEWAGGWTGRLGYVRLSQGEAVMDFELDSLFDKPQEPGQRKRGGQPGNLNALKHGRYSRRLREPEAEAGLDEEIVLLRTLLRRISEMAKEPGVELATLLKALNVIGATIDRLARLRQVQKEFGEANINGEAAIMQAISEVAKELGIQ